MVKMLSIEQVAEAMGVHPATVHLWISSNRLPAVRVGKVWRIRQESLTAFQEAGGAPEPDDQVKLEDAADQLGVSVQVVRRLLRNGELPGGKVGKLWRVSKSGLEAFSRGELPPAAADTDPPPSAEAGSHGAGGHPAAAPVGVDRAPRTERGAGNDKPARRVAGGR